MGDIAFDGFVVIDGEDGGFAEVYFVFEDPVIGGIDEGIDAGEGFFFAVPVYVVGVGELDKAFGRCEVGGGDILEFGKDKELGEPEVLAGGGTGLGLGELDGIGYIIEGIAPDSAEVAPEGVGGCILACYILGEDEDKAIGCCGDGSSGLPEAALVAGLGGFGGGVEVGEVGLFELVPLAKEVNGVGLDEVCPEDGIGGLGDS